VRAEADRDFFRRRAYSAVLQQGMSEIAVCLSWQWSCNAGTPVFVLLCKKLVSKKRFPEVVDLVLNFDKLKFQGFTTQGLNRLGLFEQQDPEFSKLVREFLDG